MKKTNLESLKEREIIKNSKLRQAELVRALREAMRYLECTTGERGDLVGCSVSEKEWTGWKNLSKLRRRRRG